MQAVHPEPQGGLSPSYNETHSARLQAGLDVSASAPVTTAPLATTQPNQPTKSLYTPEERIRRDTTVWTLVQAILAPVQFLVFLISLGLVGRYLATGQGYEIATISILIKTFVLYAIMITGSIWEKVVFGKWLFAPSFFWEDVFSMLVLGLQTLYLFALVLGWWSPQTQMYIAIAAYAAYMINAGQFLWKLRVARLEAPPKPDLAATYAGQTA
jgi:3-vinyl bacteriochlorophyllide hydratase